MTPLHVAALFGFMDTVNLLVENKANLGIKNSENMTSFDDIVKADNIDLLECVYEHTKNLKRDADDVSNQHYL